MRNIKKLNKQVIGTILAGTLAITGVWGLSVPSEVEVKADAISVNAQITKELIEKRSKFVKQFAMSDGSFTAVTYSMPVHYKKNGKWKEIDTTLKKSGKKNYKTKSTDLCIKVSKKLSKKSLVSLKRGSYKVSWALLGKKTKSVKAKISNPKKTNQTDVLNQNTVIYKNPLKNTKITYNIFPERVQEIVTVSKKEKAKKWTFKINSGKMNVKVKGKKVYFKTKKGNLKYTKLKTILTDAKGISTTNVKVKYNKKKRTLTITPSKKWWNSKERTFPIEMRTSYITSKHSRDVKVGAAYSGAPNGTASYDRSLLLQANKCVGFTKMTSLAEVGNPNVQIRSASLHIKNEATLKMGAGKSFDIDVHKVKESWTSEKVTDNNRPSYETEPAAQLSIQKKGHYFCDVTDIVKAWYKGEANYGVALVANNTNRTYQAELDRNPYFTVNYEVVGFDGAVELTEAEPITRTVITAGQENYYYFDAKPGIAYDIYTDSTIDTQATMYDVNKERVGYADDTGVNKNFSFVGSYDGRRYLKVSAKNNETGIYTLSMKKRFTIPEVTGIKGADKYTLTWNAVENAKEYLVCVYDGGNKISEAVITGTTYDYIYTNATNGKTLGFTVTARENVGLTGETSKMIYNTDNQSEWVYMTPMEEQRKNASAVTVNEKIYVLGGENATGSLKSFTAYDTEKKTWESLPEYPGTETGICKTTMIAYNNEIYVIGGQTGTGANATILKSVYVFNTDSKQWQKKADLVDGRTNLATAVCDNKVYAFSQAGTTDKVDIYDLKTDTWEAMVMPGTSDILGAASVDNRVFVLKEEGERMYWAEYLPEDNAFDDAGTVCPYATSDNFGTPVVISGKIYMVKETETKNVLVYDAYSDEWGEISYMNLMKKESVLSACGNDLYSIGGEMAGFGVLDVVEQYSIKVQTIKKQMAINESESYELQVTAGNLDKGQTQIVTISVDPDELEIQSASSFEEEEVLKEGTDGVTLLKYQPKKGVMVLKLTGSMEQRDSYEAYQSVPVVAKVSGKTTVEITLTEKGGSS